MYEHRVKSMRELADLRSSTIITYFTSDRVGLETQIAEDILAVFSDHLDVLGKKDKISLFLYTRGGNTLTAWSLVNLIRNFCNDFEVIVPSKCHSAGTIICLGASNILMTKQATLGPIDPSTNGLFNPDVVVNNQTIKAPVSVENVNGYIELIKEDLGITDHIALSNLLIDLSNKIHPIALGEVYRSKTQIQMIAKKLLSKQGIKDESIIDKIVSFLCSESGSHDYTIYRDEAMEELNLNVQKPTDREYELIKSIYKDIEVELELNRAYDPTILLAERGEYEYSLKRGLIESEEGGCHMFLSKGKLHLHNIPQQTNFGVVNNQVINDSRSSEGWEKIN